MPGAVIVADQSSGAGAGTPGVARNDLWQNQIVDLSVGTSGNSTYQWELLAKPPGSASSITGPTTSNASFLPDLSGTYRVRLTTNGGGAGNVQTLVLRVRKDSSGTLTNRGWALPAFGEVAGESNYSGNLRGWAEPIEFVFADLLANAFTGGGGGGGITSLAGLTASVLTISNGGGVNVVANTSNLAFSLGFVGTNLLGDIPVRGGSNYARLPIGSTGQVLTVVGGTAAWATPTTGVTSLASATGALTFGTAGNVVGAAAGQVLNFSITVASQAQGDVLYFDGAAWVRLPAGTSGQFLKTLGAAANPAWADVPAAPVTSVAGRTGVVTVTQGAGVLVTTPSSTDITIKKGYAGQARGDVDYFDGTNWVRLPAGTSGQLLKTNGTGADPAWVTNILSLNAQTGAVTLSGSNGVLVGTPSSGNVPLAMGFSGQQQGDVTYFDGTNWVRLPVGTSGQFLKTNGAAANPAWATVAIPVPSVAGLTGALTFAGVSSTCNVTASGSGTTITLKIELSSQVQGDVLYFDGTNWVRLGAGTSGQFLKTNGAAANPAWATVTATLAGGVDGEVWAANSGVQGFSSSPRIGGTIVAMAPTNFIQNTSSQTFFGLGSGILTLGHSTASSGGVYSVGGATGQFRFVHGSAISWNITRATNVVNVGTDAAATALNITLGTTAQSSGTAGNLTIVGQDASNSAVAMGNVVLKVGRNTADATKIGRLQVTTGAATLAEIANDNVSFAPGASSGVAFRFGSLTDSINSGHNVIALHNGTAPTGAGTNCGFFWVEAGVIKAMGASGTPQTLAA